MIEILALLLLVMLVFGRSMNGEWVFDDPAILDMAQSDFPAGYGRIARLSDLRLDRSLTHFTYYWTWRLFGLWRPAWHFFSLALHSGVILLTYALLRPFLGSDGAVIGAAIMGFHPLQTSAVCYISGRAGMMATFFTFCGLNHFLLALSLLPETAGASHLTFALLSQFFVCKSKQDGLIYLLFYPIVFYFYRLT